ncbi:SDR family NAD(P)-dependent oxidoreductase [Nocardia sp. NPDC057663]|uniref:SDR family NAD(P)-dependent oxidoreductase n=1 Tax=Nocardia sp. NPDC057663 TaxID=3346201 RepID=UPI0036728C02
MTARPRDSGRSPRAQEASIPTTDHRQTSHPTRWSRALVTDTSAGIGTSIAEDLAALGVNLVLVARSEHTLHQLAESLQTAPGNEGPALRADLTYDRARNAPERPLGVDPVFDSPGHPVPQRTPVRRNALTRTDRRGVE